MGTSIRRPCAAPSVQAWIVGAVFHREHGTTGQNAHHVLHRGGAGAGLSAEGQRATIHHNGVYAAPQAAGTTACARNRQTPPRPGPERVGMAAEEDGVAEVEGAAVAGSDAGCAVNAVQDQLGTVALHCQPKRVPLAVVHLDTVNGYGCLAQATVKLVLQSAVHNLQE